MIAEERHPRNNVTNATNVTSHKGECNVVTFVTFFSRVSPTPLNALKADDLQM
jgi:hypothetical protein